MYYKLKQPFALRGWMKVPYALTDMEQGETLFITAKEFEALSLCNGKIDTNSVLIENEYREILQKIEERGLIEGCESASFIHPEQEYQKYPARYIKMAHWSVTGRCNYHCKHCYMSAPDAKYGELSTESCFDIIDQLHECGIMNVTLTGGEPLVRKDFMQLVDRLLGYGIQIRTIYSNGKLVTPTLLDQLAQRGVYPEFNMSFDGVGWHDWLRGVPGAEQIAIDAFSLCRERGFSTAAEITLHQKNKHTLEETIDLLAKLGVRHVKVNPAALVGGWAENAGEDHLTISEVYELYLEYIGRFIETGSPLNLQLGGFFSCGKGTRDYFVPAMKYPASKEAETKCICGHARLVMYISADGRTLPCMAISGMEIGQQFPLIAQKGMKQCITDSAYMSLIDLRLKEFLERNETCNQCEHKYVCGGGCRAAALGFTPNDLYAADYSVCEILKKGYPERIRQVVQGCK